MVKVDVQAGSIIPALVGTAIGSLLGTFEKKPGPSQLVETKAY